MAYESTYKMYLLNGRKKFVHVNDELPKGAIVLNKFKGKVVSFTETVTFDQTLDNRVLPGMVVQLEDGAKIEALKP